MSVLVGLLLLMHAQVIERHSSSNEKKQIYNIKHILRKLRRVVVSTSQKMVLYYGVDFSEEWMHF